MSDVVVIGGGIIGCAIARALGAVGAEVLMVDPRHIGQGASRASAGMLAPFTEGQHDAALQALGVSSLDLYDALVASLRDEGETIAYTRDGSIEVACDEASVAALARVASELSAAAVGHRLLTAESLRACEPSLAAGVRGGLHIPAHGAVDVPALVGALWRSAERRGAKRLTGRVTAVRSGRDGMRVETSEGELRTRRAVLAAGSWASQVELDGAPRVPVRPIRGQLIALRLARQVLRHAVWGPCCYLVPWDDGGLLVGATVEDVGFDERATAGGVTSLLTSAIALVPSLADAGFGDVRVGLRPGTADGRPLVGLSRRLEGLVYATGHYRNGALLAPLTAQAVTHLVEGRPLDPVWSPCRPDRFDGDM